MRGLFRHRGVIAMAALFAAFSAAPRAEEAKPAPALEAVNMSDVFGRGEDGYPQVRIPAVVVTPQGTVLAFAEARQAGDHSEDDYAHIAFAVFDAGSLIQPNR